MSEAKENLKQLASYWKIDRLYHFLLHDQGIRFLTAANDICFCYYPGHFHLQLEGFFAIVEYLLLHYMQL